jgi:hypothetical protein
LFNSHAITTETATEAQQTVLATPANDPNVAPGTPINPNGPNFTRPSNFLGPFIARLNVKVSF